MICSRSFSASQPVKAAPYTTHAQFADPEATLKLPAPAPGLVLVTANYHYARAVAHAAKKDAAGAKAEIELPEGTQHGKTFRLRGKGIKGVRSSYPGDLYCHIVVETPVKLTEHQRKLLKELDESFRKGGDKHSPNAKSWTDRVKDLFK